MFFKIFILTLVLIIFLWKNYQKFQLPCKSHDRNTFITTTKHTHTQPSGEDASAGEGFKDLEFQIYSLYPSALTNYSRSTKSIVSLKHTNFVAREEGREDSEGILIWKYTLMRNGFDYNFFFSLHILCFATMSLVILLIKGLLYILGSDYL